MVLIRPAEPSDVPAISRVCIGSITELCHADHQGDPEAIARWTANKTPEGVVKWLGQTRTPLFVAERDGAVAGACACRLSGEVVLNYVAPGHRFAGVSRAMLRHMEAALAAAGCTRAELESTSTALPFYLANGWTRRAASYEVHGITHHPLERPIAPQEPAVANRQAPG